MNFDDSGLPSTSSNDEGLACRTDNAGNATNLVPWPIAANFGSNDLFNNLNFLRINIIDITSFVPVEVEKKISIVRLGLGY